MTITYRAPTLSTRGVVVAPHHYAAFAGAQALAEGGNALDAAIAANAVLAVVWPHMCGLGGDLFLLYHEGRTGQVYGLNASGRAPRAASWQRLRELGHARMPEAGLLAVSVPGVVDGWFHAHRRFGRLELGRLLAPAVRYAAEGFPVTDRLSRSIGQHAAALAQLPGAADVFLPGGRAPRPGDLLRQPDLARSLRLIAAQGPEAFYQGEIGAAIAAYSARHGGLLSADDLAEHQSEWVEPLRSTYRGIELLQMPPNSQGLTALLALNILEGFDLAAAGAASAEVVHLAVEAKKLAFADRDRYVSDPAFVAVPVAGLLDKRYAARRRSLLDPRRAARDYPAGAPADGDTVYLCAADRDGNVASLIQSLFHAFGAKVLVEGTGIVLQNRAAYFSLDPEHVNRLEPGKRTLHTLMPALALRDGRPLYAFGTRGAEAQAQTQLQLVIGLVDFGLEPQAAIEAPRWTHGGQVAHLAPDALAVEGRLPATVVAELRARGHNVFVLDDLDDALGTAQLIQVDQERGLLVGAADPRGDSAAIGW